MNLRRVTISVDKDLYRIIQKMRAYILGETDTEMSFAEAINRLVRDSIEKRSKLNGLQHSHLEGITYLRIPEYDEGIYKYENKFFKEELPKIIDEMIKQHK